MHLCLKYYRIRQILNLSKTFFLLVTKTLRKQVVKDNIVRKTYDEFVTRVRETILSFIIAKLDRINEPMNKRVTLIMKDKGCRISY